MSSTTQGSIRTHATPARRSRLPRVSALAAALTLASGLSLSPAFAAPADTERVEEHFTTDQPVAFGPGEGPCVPYAGTYTESRDGWYDLVLVGTGPRATELKVTGRVAGHLEVQPGDPADGPSYSGDYNEQVAGWFWHLEPDLFRVGHFSLSGRLAGSDGSTLLIQSTYRVTLRPDHTLVVERESSTCTAR